MKPKAIVFDAYGTLFDVNSAAEKCKNKLGNKWESFANFWRTTQLEYTWLRSLMKKAPVTYGLVLERIQLLQMEQQQADAAQAQISAEMPVLEKAPNQKEMGKREGDKIKLKGEKNKVWCFIGDMTFETGFFYEAHKYARNFDLPLYFVVEDNGVSTNTPTSHTWNGIQREIPKDVIYYNYKSKYPHYGTGKWVVF